MVQLEWNTNLQQASTTQIADCICTELINLFSGSGELDNGMTVSFHYQAWFSYTSQSVSLDMGDMGTLSMQHNIAGIGTIQDKVPNCW